MAKRQIQKQKEEITEDAKDPKYKGRAKRLQWKRFKTATILTIIVGIIGGVIFSVAILGLIQKIEPDNLCPIITSVPNLTAEKGKLYTYQVVAKDPDGDALGYSVKFTGIPGENLGEGVKIDENGLVTWNVPNENPSKRTYIRVEVFDGKLNYMQAFYVTLPEYNNFVPIINTSVEPSLIVLQNEQYRYFFDIIDFDNVMPKIDHDLSSPREGLIDIGGVGEQNSTFKAYVFFKEGTASKYVRVVVWITDGNDSTLYSYIAYSVWVKPDINVQTLYVLLIVGAILIAGVVFDFYRMYGY